MGICYERTCCTSETVLTQVLNGIYPPAQRMSRCHASVLQRAGDSNLDKLTHNGEKNHRSERKLRNFTPVGNAADLQIS